MQIVVDSACRSLASLMREASLLVQRDGRFIRTKDFEFKASKARREGRVDRIAEKLAPEATSAEADEQPNPSTPECRNPSR
jgi:hypothetical protein